MVLNVRLSEDDERVVRGLRRAGVNVSALVRRALRDAKTPSGKARKSLPSERLQKIFDENPVEPGSEEALPPLDDRKAMKAWLLKKMSR